MPLAVRYRSAAGAPLISVTQVLTLAGRIDATWFTPESALRGQLVHTLTEAIDRGEAVTCYGLDGYLDAYREFLAVVRPVYVASEVAVTRVEWGLGGRIDRVCADLLGGPALLDLKTGPPYPWHGQQLAAYNALHPTGSRWTVHLSARGRYVLLAHTDPIDHRRFFYDLARVRGTVYPDGDFWIDAA